MHHCPSRLVCLFTVLTLAGTTSVMANNETTTPPPSLPGLLSSFGGSKILLIGLLDSDLTIITKDASPLVYDVPMDKFVKSKVDLYGLAPVELSSKWPAHSDNSNFTSKVLSKQQSLSISIKLDSEKLVFVFTINPDSPGNGLVAVTFSVNPPSASYQEYGIDDGFIFPRAHFISSSVQNVFFDLVVDLGKSYQLLKYVYQAGRFNLTSTSVMCKQMGTNGTEMIVFKDLQNSVGCIPTDWDIQNGGFVDQNRFHFFSHDTVYIFEYTGAGGADPAGVPVTAVKLSDFFVSVTPTTTTTKIVSASTGKAGASTGTIIALVCVLLAVLVIIIAVVVWCKCNKKGPRPNDLEMSQNSKGPVGQSQAQSSQFQKQSASAQASTNGQMATDAKALGSSKAKQMRSSRTPSAKNKVKLSAKVKLTKFGKQSKATSLKGTK